jgi:hypothetical protein
MAHRLLFRLFVGPRGRGGRTSSSVALLEEAAGWLDAVCSGSLLSRPGGAVRDVRDRRSSETTDGACRRLAVLQRLRHGPPLSSFALSSPPYVARRVVSPVSSPSRSKSDREEASPGAPLLLFAGTRRDVTDLLHVRSRGCLTGGRVSRMRRRQCRRRPCPRPHGCRVHRGIRCRCRLGLLL